MTRKDYKLIADVLARIMPEGARAMVVKQMAVALKQDNPRFNETLFYYFSHVYCFVLCAL